MSGTVAIIASHASRNPYLKVSANFAKTANDWDMVAPATALPSFATITRSGSASVVGSNGYIQTRAANTVRYDYDSVSGAFNGLLLEASRTNLIPYSNFASGWTAARATLASTTATIGPDGGLTAYRIQEDTTAGNNHVGGVAVTGVSTYGNYTISVFAKAGQRRYFMLWVSASANGTPNLCQLVVDLQTGTVTATYGSPIGATVTSFKNGWYRISLTAAHATGSQISVNLAPCSTATPGTNPTYNGDGASGLYVWGPQIELGDFPSSYIPTTGTAITRGDDALSFTGVGGRLSFTQYTDALTGVTSVATPSVLGPGTLSIAPVTWGWINVLRVYQGAYAEDIVTPWWIDSSGTTGNRTVIDSTGMIAWAPANMLTYSQDFTNAAWSKSAMTLSSSTEIAPDGTATAGLLLETTATSGRNMNHAAPTDTSGTFNYSLHIKSNGRQFASVGISNSAGTAYITATFDLTNGANTQNIVVGTTYTRVASSIEPLGNGWYRCSITATITAVVQYFLVSPNTTGTPTLTTFGLESYTGDITKGLYVWGAQIERVTYQTYPCTYQPTTSAAVYLPRYAYDPSTSPATPLGMLVEEARTNLCTYSQDLSLSYAFTGLLAFGSGSSLDATIAPSGFQSADLITEDTSTGYHRLYKTITSAANNPYAFSFYVKRASGSRNVYVLYGAGSDYIYAHFDLTAGTVINSGFSGASTIYIADISSVGNDWFRIAMSGVSSTTQTAIIPQIAMSNSSASLATMPSYAGDGASGLYLYGLQYELGAFATSYIPTFSATVTRAADTVKWSSSAFTQFWNAGEGTLIVEATSRPKSGYADGSAAPVAVGVVGPSTNYLIAMDANTTEVGRFLVLNNASIMANLAPGSWPVNTTSRMAGCYKLNDFVASQDGGTSVTDTAGSLPALATLYLGAMSSAAGHWGGYIRSFAYYDRRLTNAALEVKSVVGAPL